MHENTRTVTDLHRRKAALVAEMQRRGGCCPWLTAELAAVGVELCELTGNRGPTYAERVGFEAGPVDRCRRGARP